MKKMSRSPDRHSFQKRSYQRKIEQAESQDSVDAALSMLNLYETWNQQELELEESDEWKKNNMSYDLCTTDWILDKVRSSEAYAQNLYAAMCNNSFQKLETWPILKDEQWSCSWRSAGGIIADMRQEGDYIDWYCSGIRNSDTSTDEEQSNWTEEQKHNWQTIFSKYVSESCVTEEIENDLNKLGWRVIKDDNKPI